MVDSRIDELRRRLERDPGSRLFAQLAEEYRKAGNQTEAIRVARAGLSHHPSYPSARVTLGRALLEAGDPGGAKTELELALREAPDNILASRFLGQALEAQGDFEAALERHSATLRMVPGDRLLESQIRSLNQRLGSARTVGAGASAGPHEVARAMARAALPAESEGGDEGPLPPTIRIRMHPDRVGPSERPPEPEPPQRAPLTARAGQESPGGPLSESEAAPLSAEPFYESDVAPTLPTVHASELERSSTGEGGVPTPEATGILEAKPAEAEPVRVEAVEATVLEAEAVEAPAEPVPVGGEPVSAEAQAQGGAPLAGEPEPAWSGEREEAGSAPPAAPEATPFSSSTLAELYFRQGLVDRAVEVYRQVLVSEPGNERARARLEELVALAEPAAVGGPATRAEEERAARRRALERTIARLEALLTVVRGR